MMDIKTPKGKPTTIHEGYLYRYDRMAADGGRFWRCIKYGCPGRIKTETGGTVQVKNAAHNHINQPEDIAKRRVNNALHQRAEDESTPLSRIHRETLNQVANEPSIAAILPTYRSAHAAMSRRRRAMLPPLPADRVSIQIPESLKKTKSGEDFLMHSGVNNDFIVFCSPSSLRILCDSDVVSMDGTFAACPAVFQQLFTIHAFNRDHLLPVVYCFMADKTQQMYTEVFNLLQQKALQQNLTFSPRIVISDFESGLIPAVSACLQNARHQGCHFHFCQAIYRQVQSLGLTNAYMTDPTMRIQIRQLMALAFVPVVIVRIVFGQLQAASAAQLGPLFDYFNRQWLTNIRTSMWNVYGVTRRTNNDVEGWHHRLNTMLSRHHPNIWQVIRCLQDEQASMEVTRAQISAGQLVRRPNKKYAALQKRIDRLQEQYDRGEITAVEYITGVSYNMAELQ